jgi:hypothetical protein
MKDSELRGRILQLLYDSRREVAGVPLGFVSSAPVISGVDPFDVLRACEQLHQHNLIEWEKFHGEAGRDFGIATINAFGCDIIEGHTSPPIAINIDQSQQISVIGSQGVQIAGALSNQQQTISDSFEKIISVIESSTLSATEKTEARSLIVRLLQSKAAIALFGGAAEFLLKKYFGI